MIAFKMNDNQVKLTPDTNGEGKFTVIHPLFDVEEEKYRGLSLGRMKMSPSVKWSLIALRIYLLLMFVLLAAHVWVLAHQATTAMR